MKLVERMPRVCKAVIKAKATLMSGLSILFLVSVVNMFFGSAILFKAHMSLGLVIMCGLFCSTLSSSLRKQRTETRTTSALRGPVPRLCDHFQKTHSSCHEGQEERK
ncbi:hypothetical protein J4Q44_G00257440 [Coregonus suidteri]|uniref:Uncharacterized protein n=1 Tax=Coregonus suidteri TaxID=861788 RepID=A0AAN8QG18_9TELE